MRTASPSLAAMGFSHRTCLPASSARIVHSQCSALGSGSYTASSSGSATSAS